MSPGPGGGAEGGRRPRPHPTGLAITVAVDGSRGELACAGALDATSGPQLRDAAGRLIAAKCRQVVLDLSAIMQCDLAGVRALAELGVVLEQAGVELTIRNADAATYPVDWHAIPRSRR